MDIKPLPLRVRRALHEPAYGVLNRMALRHGFDTTAEFVKTLWCGPSIPTKAVGSDGAVDAIAALANMPVAELRGNTFVARPGRQAFLGPVAICGEEVNLKYGRICSACVWDDVRSRSGPQATRPYRRFWWDAASIRACPLHRTVLTERCPGCGTTLSRLFVSPMRCGCGHDLGTHHEDVLPPSDVKGDAYLVGRITGQVGCRNPQLDLMPFQTAAGAMLTVGRASLWKAPRKITDVSAAEIARATGVALDVCAGWPAGFRALLDQRFLSRDHADEASLQSCYGPLYHWLSFNKAEELDVLRSEISRHATENLSSTSRMTARQGRG